MSDVDDLVTWLRAQLDEDERVAREAGYRALGWSENGTWYLEGVEHNVVGQEEAFCHPHNVAHIARHDPARVLAEVDAKRRILDEHAPEWQTVEWPHDQNGKGEAQVCRRCQNAEHTQWNPPVGQAGVLPEGFVAPYVVWPCLTAQLLALPYADRPGYRDEWRRE